MYECRVERDSVTVYGERLITIVLTLPRIVLAELNTHRVFTRSSASSRAIPVARQIAKLKEDPFVPFYWGKNQKGMQANEELTPELQEQAQQVWLESRDSQVSYALRMMELGVHKQLTNRLLECFMYHEVIITATEWDNWDHLRREKDAAPEIQRAAVMMHECSDQSRPKVLDEGQWHLPFTTDEEQSAVPLEELIQVSVGRSARVSYANHDGVKDRADDLRLAARCRAAHMAPWEHAARPMTARERGTFMSNRMLPVPMEPTRSLSGTMFWRTGMPTYFLGNFNGWVQARKLIHGEWDIARIAKKAE